ncbi:hypothetical protein [Streptomyces longisporoflavus]|nr:hypothetical protein [Streptomyces longisporoflavus]
MDDLAADIQPAEGDGAVGGPQALDDNAGARRAGFVDAADEVEAAGKAG